MSKWRDFQINVLPWAVVVVVGAVAWWSLFRMAKQERPETAAAQTAAAQIKMLQVFHAYGVRYDSLVTPNYTIYFLKSSDDSVRSVVYTKTEASHGR